MSLRKCIPLVALLFIIFGCVQHTTAQTPQNVVWTNVVNATPTGNTLQKTSNGNDHECQHNQPDRNGTNRVRHLYISIYGYGPTGR